jgi:hypothetical protein
VQRVCVGCLLPHATDTAHFPSANTSNNKRKQKRDSENIRKNWWGRGRHSGARETEKDVFILSLTQVQELRTE